MKELERARRRYDEIPVPAELNGRIEQAAAAAKKQLESRWKSPCRRPTARGQCGLRWNP